MHDDNMIYLRNGGRREENARPKQKAHKGDWTLKLPPNTYRKILKRHRHRHFLTGTTNEKCKPED